jgi:hypothetical protein
MSAAPQGTIRRTAAPRPDLLSFEVLGHVPAEDMAWMARQVDDAFAVMQRVDMLIVMRGFEGADAGALVDPAVVKVQLRSLGKVRRYAVVGAPAWARTMIEAFDHVIPVDARTFDPAEEIAAREWLEAP